MGKSPTDQTSEPNQCHVASALYDRLSRPSARARSTSSHPLGTTVNRPIILLCCSTSRVCPSNLNTFVLVLLKGSHWTGNFLQFAIHCCSSCYPGTGSRRPLLHAAVPRSGRNEAQPVEVFSTSQDPAPKVSPPPSPHDWICCLVLPTNHSHSIVFQWRLDTSQPDCGWC